VLQHSFTNAGVSTMSFWAAVPLYASQVPSPKAALALMERACQVIGTPVPAEALTDEIAEYEERVEQLVERDRETTEMVRRFEREDLTDELDEIDDDEDDTDEDEGPAPLAAEDPDHLIAEVERFLRDQGQG
jgi:DNA repair exonuclease SbcCD ATPase subunit